MRIVLHDIEYSEKDRVILKGITCSFTKGITYVVGKNGAGKSTLLKLLTTALQSVHGEINYTLLVRDKEIGTYRKNLSIEEIRKISGFLPQHFTGRSEMTVEKYLTYMAFQKGIPQKLIKKNVNNWLKESNLTQVKRRKIRHISGGQLKKVGLIQALINLPRICILDEPFEGLDIGERHYFQNMIQRLSYHSIVIISTHLLKEIQYSSEDKLLFLKEGRVAYFGGIEALNAVDRELEA